MGLQEISDKKVRQARIMTGLRLIRCMRHSNDLWYGWVRDGAGHWHVRINPKTWSWRVDRNGGFASCAEKLYGPDVDPPRAFLELSSMAARAELMQARGDRLLQALRFYADPRCYELQENWAAIAGKSLETYVPIEDDKGALARAAIAAEED